MQLIRMILFILPSLLPGSAAIAQQLRSSVLVCYGKLNPASISGYKYLIIEPQHYKAAEVRRFGHQNDKVLAYISLGEVNAHAKHFDKLKGQTLGRNRTWNSYYLDLSSARTRAILMGLISDGIASGYDGFFLDNIDNFTQWGPQHAHQKHLITFLEEVQRKFPKHTFVQNAGIDIISKTAPFVDAILVESTATDYSFQAKTYRLRDEKDFRLRVARLESAAKKYRLPVIMVEYADTKKLRDAVVKRIAPYRFSYFIGNINLQSIPKFDR